jgi:hypothetical protein
MGLLGRGGRSGVQRTNSDGANAIGAIVEKDPEIVLVGGSAGAGLAASKPALGAEMFEEGMKALAPIMIACIRRQRAGDACRPPLVIDKACIAAGFAQPARGAAFEGDEGAAIRDKSPR